MSCILFLSLSSSKNMGVGLEALFDEDEDDADEEGDLVGLSAKETTPPTTSRK